MADTGWIIAGAGANVNIGSTDWTNPGTITADDGLSASVALKDTDSDYLKASNFGFAIPTGATIDGIAIRVKARVEIDGSTGAIFYVAPWKDDSTAGTDLCGTQDLTTTFTNYDYGGATELAGLTLTVADVNASTFQCRIRCHAGNLSGLTSDYPDVDTVWMKIYYTEAGAGGEELNQGSAQLIGL